jgi:hypothetical protein
MDAGENPSTEEGLTSDSECCDRNLGNWYHVFFKFTGVLLDLVQKLLSDKFISSKWAGTLRIPSSSSLHRADANFYSLQFKRPWDWRTSFFGGFDWPFKISQLVGGGGIKYWGLLHFCFSLALIVVLAFFVRFWVAYWRSGPLDLLLESPSRSGAGAGFFFVWWLVYELGFNLSISLFMYFLV